jgi:hypothetical protein
LISHLDLSLYINLGCCKDCKLYSGLWERSVLSWASKVNDLRSIGMASLWVASETDWPIQALAPPWKAVKAKGALFLPDGVRLYFLSLKSNLSGMNLSGSSH